MRYLPADYRLSDREKSLVDAIKRGKSLTEASRACGYSSTPLADHYLRSPQVLAALEYELRRRMLVRLVPMAINHYISVLGNPTASNSDKNNAARAVLDRAGIVPPKAPDGKDDSAKDINELSPTELQAFIHDAQQALARQARDITPVDAVADPDLIDLI